MSRNACFDDFWAFFDFSDTKSGIGGFSGVLFGQSKSNLDYTQPGTPGFDIWDEILTGYINYFLSNRSEKIFYI